MVRRKYLRYVRKNYNLEELRINSLYLEQVQSNKYLGSTVNSDKSIEEEIRNRITLGNKVYYDNQFLFKCRLASKKLKMKFYWSFIRPIVTYGCETWVFKGTVKNKLMVFERKVLRNIFGPTKEGDGTWRIKTNDELNKLIGHENIINYIKEHKVGLVIYIECQKREWLKNI